jgi:hypothetical protein
MLQSRTRSCFPGQPAGHAELCELTEIVVLIDGHISAPPVDQSAGRFRRTQIQDPPDHDGMRMPFDDIFDLTLKCNQGVYEKRYTGRSEGFQLAPA